MNSNERTVLRVETSLATKDKEDLPRPSVPSSNERFKRKRYKSQCFYSY